MHNQTLITVRDVQASADWYTKNLGLAKGHGGAYYEQLIYKGKLILQLHNMDPDENHGALLDIGELPGKGVLIWLRVEHFDELVERLGGNQVPFDKGPFFNQRAKQWEVWFKDPDGYRIVLSGPSEYPVLALRK